MHKFGRIWCLMASLLTLMPMFYYYKLPLTTGCKCSHIASPQDKVRVPRTGDPYIPSDNPALSSALQPVLPDAVQKSGVYMQGDVTVQRSGTYARQKPAFVPEFHGFEMFVWSLQHSEVPLQSQVTWVSQMTSDRISALKQLLLVWKGPICIALYTTHVEEDFNIVAPFIDRVDFHFVAASQGPYPVNAMRNVALEHARTRYVLLADIDFYPSESISLLAEQWSEKYIKSELHVALVLPAFYCQGNPDNFPRNKLELIAKASSRACHQIHDDPGRIIAHNATNYPRYMTALEPFDAVYSFPWEPYFIADKTDLPRYDARFAGYGNDKAVQTFEMSLRGFKFLVVPDAFVIHIEHEAGPWRLALNMDRKQLMDTMISTFFSDMRRRYKVENTQKREIPSHVHPMWGIRGENCDIVCARQNQRCDPAFSSIINSCEVLERFGRCLFGCSDVLFGSDMPNIDVTRQLCLSNSNPRDYAFSCSSQHHNTKRLCPCVA